MRRTNWTSTCIQLWRFNRYWSLSLFELVKETRVDAEIRVNWRFSRTFKSSWFDYGIIPSNYKWGCRNIHVRLHSSVFIEERHHWGTFQRMSHDRWHHWEERCRFEWYHHHLCSDRHAVLWSYWSDHHHRYCHGTLTMIVMHVILTVQHTRITIERSGFRNTRIWNPFDFSVDYDRFIFIVSMLEDKAPHGISIRQIVSGKNV